MKRRLPLALLSVLVGHLAPVHAAAPAVKILSTKVASPDTSFYQAWPTIAARQNGELVVVYSGGRNYYVCPFGRVELISSRDGGETWSWPRVVLDSVSDDRDAGVLETSRGTLLVFSFTSLAYQGHLVDPERLLLKTFKNETPAIVERWLLAEARVSREEMKRDVGMWMLRSTDGGRTWSERLPTPCNSPHGPIQLRDGRLLYAGKELWSAERSTGVWESRDDGISWQALATFTPRSNDKHLEYHELHAVEAADGTLLAHIRNHNGGKRDTLQSESKDGGKTWTVPHEIGVSGYPSHLLRLKDGTLLMTYSYRVGPYGIRGKVSKDHGTTWSAEFVLTNDGATWDLGYPSTVQLADGALLTVWYEVPKGTTKSLLRQAKWRLR